MKTKTLKETAMENIKKCRIIATNLVLFLIFGISQFVSAQSTNPDFSSPQYAKAIHEIEANSKGKITAQIIEEVYNGDYFPSITFNESIILSPPILFVPYGESLNNEISITLSAAPTIDITLTKLNECEWITLDPATTITKKTGDDQSYTFTVSVGINPSFFSRWTSVNVSTVIGDETVLDTLYILQNPNTDVFLTATPSYQIIENNTTTAIYTILTSSAPDDIGNDNDINNDFTFDLTYDSNNTGWITDTTETKITDNEYILTLTLTNNQDEGARLVSIVTKANFGGVEKSADPVLLLQKASNLDPFIFVSPAHQIIEYDDTQADYTILTSGLPDINGDDKVDISDFMPNFFSGDLNWFNSFMKTVDSINLNTYVYEIGIESNSTNEARYVDFTLHTKIDGDTITSEETILVQKSVDTAAFLMASPREKQVSHKGNTNLIFDVQRVNISEWEVAKVLYPEQGDDWITWNDPTDFNKLTLIIAPNSGLTTRSAKVVIQGELPYSFIKDTVSVYQYSGLDSYLMASPREITVDQDTNTVDYQILAVNIEDGWEIVPSTKPWILDAKRINDSLLRITVDSNSMPQSRADTVRIRGKGDDSGIEDVVKIYQYSALDTFLLSSPREKKVPYFGNTDVKFHVKKVNCANWDVDLSTLPQGDNPWITLNDSVHPDTVSFTVHANPELSSRSKTIYIWANEENSTVFDSISIYQFARPDLFLLASPREQKVAHFGNTNVEFDMKRVNIPNWELIPGTLPDGNWIELNEDESTIDKLVLNVLPNDVDSTRYDTIFVRATTNDTVIDTVAIYQYSSIDSYLLMAPRERKVSHLESEINFKVTVVNIEGGWKIEQHPEWVDDLTVDGENTLKLRVTENTTDTSRYGMIVIRGKEIAYEDIKDTVMVYQYSKEDKYLLIAPRVDTVSYKGNSFLVFDVNAVNTGSEKWEIAPSTPGLNDWVFDNGSNFYDLLRLDIKPNDIDTTRQTSLRIRLEDNPEVFDEVSIFQFAEVSSYILTAPREQVVYWNYLGDLPRAFEIEAVNVGGLGWKYLDENDAEWLNEPHIVNNELLFSIKNTNNTLNVRKAEIEIYDQNNTSIADKVTIYQKTTFEPYIIPLPPKGDTLPKLINYPGDAFQINTYSNLESYVASIPIIDSSWLHLSSPTNKTLLNESLGLKFNDSIWITVDSNDISYPRASTITFAGNGITEKFYLILEEGVRDTVPVEGTIKSGDQIAITEPIVVIAGTFSDTMNVGQQNYTVYVDKGWQGTIRPESNRYYFEPPQLLYDTVKGGIVDTLNNQDFTAYLIDPKVEFLTNEFEICFGDTLKLDTLNVYNYPQAFVSGTYGPITYEWKLTGGDNNSISNATILDPDFYPQWNSTYKLIISNSGFKDSATVTVYVNALPAAVDIFNPQTVVCKNQGGVVYQAGEIPDTVFVSWSLPLRGGTFIGDTNTNIAVIDWGNDPLITESELYLFTTDVNGCKAREPFVETIKINESQESRMPTSVVLKGENYLTCGDGSAAYYQWGWYEMEKGQIKDHFIIPAQNDWYCQLPEGHVFNPEKYKYFVITYNDDEGTSCGTYSFYSIPVGIEELVESGILIYPNPTDNLIHISFSKLTGAGECKLKLYDFSGKLVYQDDRIEIRNNKAIVLNQDDTLGSGLYFLHIQIGNQFYSAKIVVK